jgi:hypothetical protein
MQLERLDMPQCHVNSRGDKSSQRRGRPMAIMRIDVPHSGEMRFPLGFKACGTLFQLRFAFRIENLVCIDLEIMVTKTIFSPLGN